jgi:type II secretory pathway pseudopilin PulG
LLVVVIVGILVQIVIPNYQNISLRARAVDLMSRINAVETAARNYQGDTFEWPADAGTGVVPPELVSNLPENFTFTGEDFDLDWENLAIPGGLPQDPTTTRLLGVAIVTDNTNLGEALVNVFGATGWYNVGNSYVFIIER